MWSGFVVMRRVETEDPLEVSSSANQRPVKALGPHRADPSFGEGVSTRTSKRSQHWFDPFGSEDLVEGAAVLRVAIVDEELKPALGF